MAQLIIEQNETQCGECGGMADPEFEAHTGNIGGSEGCGEAFDSVTTHDPALKAEVMALRPDLPWSEPR